MSYYVDRTDAQPEAKPLCDCHICGDPVYVWDCIEEPYDGRWIHPECMPEQEDE